MARRWSPLPIATIADRKERGGLVYPARGRILVFQKPRGPMCITQAIAVSLAALLQEDRSDVSRRASDLRGRCVDGAPSKAGFDNPDQFLLAGFAGRGIERDLAGMQEVDAIADFKDLIVVVDDQDDRDVALPAQVLNQSKDVCAFAHAQGGKRFVEDQDRRR